jgi:hypothetical protein
MSTHQDPSVWGAIKTFLVYVLAWVGSWKIGEVQAFAGLIAFVVTTGFGATQWYVLWRDKISKHRRPPGGTLPVPLDEAKP